MDIERLKQIAQEEAKHIGSSHVFLSVTGPDYVDDPICLMQFGLAVLLDKPLFILFVRGAKPPKNLIRVLTGYECIKGDDEASIREASERLMKKIERFIKNNEELEEKGGE